MSEVISDQTMAWLKIGPLGVAFSAMGTASLLNGIDSYQKVEREARKKEKAEKGELIRILLQMEVTGLFVGLIHRLPLSLRVSV